MPTNSKKNGFTLIELLIAAIIIAVGVLGWARTQQGSIKGRAVSNGITTASELGTAKLEELALQSQDNAATLQGNDAVTTQGVQYNRTWSIERGEILDGLDLWKIDVNVTWNHFGQRSLDYQRIVVSN